MTTRRLFWTLHVGGWAAFGLGMALSRLGRYPIDYMIATKAVLAVSGLVVSLPLRSLYRRWLSDDAPLVRTLGITVVASFVLAQVWTAIYNVSDAPIANALLRLNRPIQIDSATELFSASYYHTFAMLAWSVLYVAIKRQLALQAERERSLRAETLAQRAKLQALRFQIQPHFLFNSLNALSTLIVEEKPAQASEMLSRLSDYLRHTLSGTDENEVSLEDELAFARRYLDIEQVRFGDRLRVEMDASPEARRALVPTLILQPLLENAVRHGVAPRVDGGEVVVRARCTDDRLALIITNDAGPNGSANGAGVGLANTRARLEELYGDRQSMSAKRTDRGFEVSVEIPLRKRGA